mmetsp:Transcript_17916/g.60455  ORF Transcript_17916/g.60455 Transcript_17916/m.60455 type:complete len:287 (+) Transcript_17916:2458-3318(+)
MRPLLLPRRRRRRRRIGGRLQPGDGERLGRHGRAVGCRLLRPCTFVVVPDRVHHADAARLFAERGAVLVDGVCVVLALRRERDLNVGKVAAERVRPRHREQHLGLAVRKAVDLIGRGRLPVDLDVEAARVSRVAAVGVLGAVVLVQVPGAHLGHVEAVEHVAQRRRQVFQDDANGRDGAFGEAGAGGRRRERVAAVVLDRLNLDERVDLRRARLARARGEAADGRKDGRPVRGVLGDAHCEEVVRRRVGEENFDFFHDAICERRDPRELDAKGGAKGRRELRFDAE